MLYAVGAAAFLVGALLTRIVCGSRRGVADSEDPRNHKIRELEADLRTLQRQCGETEQELEEKTVEFDIAVETMQELRATLADRDMAVDDLNEELKSEAKKTRELRQVLQDRATQTIREQVRAEEAETELEVARAGSEAVMSEINRLQEERKNMTNTMRQLEDRLFHDDPVAEDSGQDQG